MQHGTPTLQTTLAEAHAELPATEFAHSFVAARHAYPAAKVFEMFAPHLVTEAGAKKKGDSAGAKREALCKALGGVRGYWPGWQDPEPPLDPRWLDAAVQIRHVGLVCRLIRPGHPAANAFLKETFDDLVRKPKALHECHTVVASMVYGRHPDATDAVIAAILSQKKADYFADWFARLIPELPKSAVPKLEALIPTLGERSANSLIDYLQQLKEKA